MADLLGRLESWVLGESPSTAELFASDVQVETPAGKQRGAASLAHPTVSRLIASGGNDEFGSLVYEVRDPVSGLWQRTCLVYFADGGVVRQVFVQSSDVPAPEA